MIEKRGATGETDIRTLIKQANTQEAVIVMNFDGFLKKADGQHHKEAIVIIATGERAVKLREIMNEVSR